MWHTFERQFEGIKKIQGPILAHNLQGKGGSSHLI
jgi:hypothetical protein